MRNRRGRIVARGGMVGNIRGRGQGKEELDLGKAPHSRINMEKKRVLVTWKDRWQAKEAALQEQGKEMFGIKLRGPQTRQFSNYILACVRQIVQY